MKRLSDLSRFSGLAAAFLFSGANFILAFGLQLSVSPSAFGTFALIQVVLQFGISISNALLCSPVAVAVAVSKEEHSTISGFLRANIWLSSAGAGIAAVAFFALTRDPVVVLAATLLCFMSWIRWFLRSAEMAAGHYGSPAKADLVYGLVVCAAGVGYMLGGGISLAGALWVQIAGCAAALLTTRIELARQALRSGAASLTPFYGSLRTHGSWALLGVVTTEAVANSHAWMVGFLLGPQAFAPIAAVTLLFRPVLVLTQALTQYERPKMARVVASGDLRGLTTISANFTTLSLACLGCNVAVVVGTLYFVPGVIGGGQYEPRELWAVAGVVAASYLARVLRGAQSAMLQAKGEFRSLALITAAVGPVTLFLVALSVSLAPTSAALVSSGVLIGELLTCLLIRFTHKRAFVNPGYSQ